MLTKNVIMGKTTGLGVVLLCVLPCSVPADKQVLNVLIQLNASSPSHGGVAIDG